MRNKVEGDGETVKMNKAITIAMVLALITLVFSAMPVKVNAAVVRNLGPKRGKPGLPVNIIGEGLAGHSIQVKFGSAPASATAVNDKVIRTEVPQKNLLDPNPVKVTVFVDGVQVLGDIDFLYDPPGQQPVITSFEPMIVPTGTEFIITFFGTDFMTPHGRVPDQILLIGLDLVWGTVVVSSETDTSFTADFPAVAVAGAHSIMVGFSDGSGANVDGLEVI